MENLIRVQFYRFINHPLSRYVLLPACILAAVAPILLSHLNRLVEYGEVKAEWSTHYAEFANEPAPYTFADFGGLNAANALSGSYLFFFCALVMIPLSYSVCNAFHNKTVTHELIGGYSIHQILISRLIVAAGITFLFSLITVCLSTIIVTLMNGWKGEEAVIPYSTPETVCCVILILFTLLQASMLCVLSSCIARETSTSLAISWMLYLFSFILVAITIPLINSVLHVFDSFGGDGKVMRFFSAALPGMQPLLLFQVETNPLPEGEDALSYLATRYVPISQFLPVMLIGGIAMIALFYLIAYLRLKYSEIREEI